MQRKTRQGCAPKSLQFDTYCNGKETRGAGKLQWVSKGCEGLIHLGTGSFWLCQCGRPVSGMQVWRGVVLQNLALPPSLFGREPQVEEFYTVPPLPTEGLLHSCVWIYIFSCFSCFLPCSAGNPGTSTPSGALRTSSSVLKPISSIVLPTHTCPEQMPREASNNAADAGRGGEEV